MPNCACGEDCGDRCTIDKWQRCERTLRELEIERADYERDWRQEEEMLQAYLEERDAET
jgi:hypothetical protein